jgi:hypothetical protein
MPKTTVVNCRTDEYDIYIGRPSKFGNPFKIGRDGNRAEVIRKYHIWIFSQPKLMASLRDIKGKRLGCWCHPLPCHGDVLAMLADKIK